MSANIHALPGLYGGGFARVVDVQEIPGTVPPQTGGGGAPALVRLERLSGSTTSFHQSLQTFLSAQKTLPTTTAQLSTSAVTILQEISNQPPLGPQQQAIGPQLPPLGPTPQQAQAQAPVVQPTAAQAAPDQTDLAALTSDGTSSATDKTDPTSQKTEADKNSGKKKKGMFDDLFADKAKEAKKFGPDPLEVLQKMLETQTSGATAAGTPTSTSTITATATATATTASTTSTASSGTSTVSGTLATGAQSPAYQTALAQQAAQAYAAALAASLSSAEATRT